LIVVRPAVPEDEQALAALDRVTWTDATSPAPPPPEPDTRFFTERVDMRDVLVAEVDGAVAGYVRLAHATPLRASDHVLTINGVAVAPEFQRRGVGRALIDAAVDEAGARGARRLTLRVLGPNAAARRLYASAGFVVEGVLRGEFRIGDEYVDDVLMARDLTA
jgi:ribosomal protein S18 acetylase RimI-like enzyme